MAHIIIDISCQLFDSSTLESIVAITNIIKQPANSGKRFSKDFKGDNLIVEKIKKQLSAIIHKIMNVRVVYTVSKLMLADIIIAGIRTTAYKA